MEIDEELKFNIDELTEDEQIKFAIRWLKDTGFYSQVTKFLYNTYWYSIQSASNKEGIQLLKDLMNHNGIQNLFNPEYASLHTTDKTSWIIAGLITVKWMLFLVNHTKDYPTTYWYRTYHKNLVRGADWLFGYIGREFDIEDMPCDLVIELVTEAPKTFIRFNFRYQFDKYLQI